VSGYTYVCGEYDEKSGVVSDDKKEKREEAFYFVWIGLILYFLRERILNRLFKLCNVVSKVFKFFIRFGQGKRIKTL
jgi:hypothetical protein